MNMSTIYAIIAVYIEDNIGLLLIIAIQFILLSLVLSVLIETDYVQLDDNEETTL